MPASMLFSGRYRARGISGKDGAIGVSPANTTGYYMAVKPNTGIKCYSVQFLFGFRVGLGLHMPLSAALSFGPPLPDWVI